MTKRAARRMLVVVATIGVVGAGVVPSWTTASSPAFHGTAHARIAAAAPTPPLHLAGSRLGQRPHAVARGTVVSSSGLFTDRVFATAHTGFALANDGNAQYPAFSTDGGHSWRIDGPQLHVDAADGPEGVGYVGIVGPRTFFAYGSSVVDVTTNGGRTWWETYLGELVAAVAPGPTRHELIAYVQQSISNDHLNPAVTWQYVSRDGGHHWSFSTGLDG